MTHAQYEDLIGAWLPAKNVSAASRTVSISFIQIVPTPLFVACVLLAHGKTVFSTSI